MNCLEWRIKNYKILEKKGKPSLNFQVPQACSQPLQNTDVDREDDHRVIVLSKVQTTTLEIKVQVALPGPVRRGMTPSTHSSQPCLHSRIMPNHLTELN